MPDHPHAGGEHSDLAVDFKNVSGPSPRGWGARMAAMAIPRLRRTIPTRVGSTAIGTTLPPICPDHPHAGGEHFLSAILAAIVVGPSPRGWGAPRADLRRARGGRTIPTRVGSTAGWQGALLAFPDHPHAGGEHGQGNPC